MTTNKTSYQRSHNALDKTGMLFLCLALSGLLYGTIPGKIFLFSAIVISLLAMVRNLRSGKFSEYHKITKTKISKQEYNKNVASK